MTRMPTAGLALLDRNLRFAGVTNGAADNGFPAMEN
jgi:hypothetical protein